MSDKSLKIVNPKERVTLYGTEKSSHHNVGEPFEASAHLAEKLIAAGKATKTLQEVAVDTSEAKKEAAPLGLANLNKA